MLTHEVWGTSEGDQQEKLYEEFDEEEWEWALKLAAILRARGIDNVHIRNKKEEDEQ